jgi:hypothetical protein
MDSTHPLSGATSSTTSAQIGQQPTKQAYTTMTETRRLSNMATPITDAPLTQPSSSDTSPATNAQTQCLLFRLSGELRNMVYDHVFGTGIVEGHIQLEDAHTFAPQSDLTITCRRIQKEVTAMHQAAFKTYWEDNAFEYPLPMAHDLPALTSQRFLHMNRIVQRCLHRSQRTFVEIRRKPDHSNWEYYVHSDTMSAPVKYPASLKVAEVWLARINESRIKTRTLTAPGTWFYRSVRALQWSPVFGSTHLAG